MSNKKWKFSILATLTSTLYFSLAPVNANILVKQQQEYCDVIVAGGSTAALAAALHSAREGAQTCLIEPTDWAGGQLTAAGVPAVDFPWREDVQGVNTKMAMKDPRNNNYEFIRWLLDIGSTGDCIVSRHCFLPQQILDEKINPAIAAEKNLRVFYQAVIKSVNVDKQQITGVSAIQRIAKPGLAYGGYDRRMSADIPDWYDPASSERFNKRAILFTGRDGKVPVVIEASEFGDVLALSKAQYRIAADRYEGSTLRNDNLCGQSMTLTYNVAYHDKPVPENAPPKQSVKADLSAFNWGTYGWDNLWIYRRLVGESKPGACQISMMNWKQGKTNNGNDYADKYLFLSYDETDRQVDSGNWAGGINIDALEGAERLSYSFYYWFKENAPDGKGDRLNLALESVGTAHGFYKYPYLRESRRSVGYDNFMIKTSDMDSFAGKTGYPYDDRVAITAYDYDIHPMNDCKQGYGFDPEDKSINPKPFFIPFRALTNISYNNLLVAGKNMAQSFKANSAIRLHPGEFTSGVAAGVTAGYMVKHGRYDTHVLVDNQAYRELQPIIRKYQPLEWIIDDQIYPAANKPLPAVTGNLVCPVETIADPAKGWCFDSETVFMTLTPEMSQSCVAEKGGSACIETETYRSSSGLMLTLHRLPRPLAEKIRGNGICPAGTAPDPEMQGYCTDPGKRKVYGVFSNAQWQRCIQEQENCRKGTTEYLPNVIGLTGR